MKTKALTVIQLGIFSLIYYIGGIISAIFIERKSYDFNTWLQTTQLVARDTRRIIGLAIPTALMFIFPWFYVLIGALLLIIIVSIGHLIVKQIKKGYERGKE